MMKALALPPRFSTASSRRAHTVKSVGSGFVSRNNPDETAKKFLLLIQEAGLPRARAAGRGRHRLPIKCTDKRHTTIYN